MERDDRGRFRAMTSGVSMQMEVSSETARKALGALAIKLGGNLRDPLDEIGASLLASTQQRFEEERDPEGERWQPLAMSTQLRRVTKRQVRGPEHILRVKNLLYQSITYLATNQELKVGSNRKYAAIHQLGGEPDMAPGPAAVPARPYLGVSADDETEIETILLEYLGEAIP